MSRDVIYGRPLLLHVKDCHLSANAFVIALLDGDGVGLGVVDFLPGSVNGVPAKITSGIHRDLKQ